VKSILINANFPALTCVEREGRKNAAGVAASEIIDIYAAELVVSFDVWFGES
jgi:hypothetical protein